MKLGSRIIKIFITSIVVAVLLFVAVFCITWGVASWGRYSDDDLTLAAQDLANNAMKAADFTLDAGMAQALVEQAANRYPGMFFELVKPDLTILVSSRGLSGRADLAGIIQYPHHFKQEWVQAQEVRTSAGLQGYALASVAEDFRTLIDVHFGYPGMALAGFMVFMGVCITLGIAGLAAWRLSRGTASRFKRLYLAFNALNFNNLDERLSDPTDDELGELATIFNHTAAKLQMQAEERKTMHENLKLLLTEVAHDLRTPLSIIAGHAEQIITRVVTDEQDILANINRIRSHSDYMSGLLEGLTDFAVAESGKIAGELSPFDMSEACRIGIIDILPLIESHGLVLEPDLPEEPVWVMGNEQWFRRAFTNILDNAIHHGGAAGQIEVKLEQNLDKAKVLVCDHGPGIRDVEKEQVFEPFFRSDRSRNSRIGGLGLGLHIARKIINHCGGELSLLESAPGNTVFCIALIRVK